MGEKELYYKLLEEMEYIINQHRKTRKENVDFDPMKNIPVEPPEDIANPEQFTPFGSLKTSIDVLYRKSLEYETKN